MALHLLSYILEFRFLLGIGVASDRDISKYSLSLKADCLMLPLSSLHWYDLFSNGVASDRDISKYSLSFWI